MILPMADEGRYLAPHPVARTQEHNMEAIAPTSGHEEALARLDYLVAARRRLGVLVGPRGSGKSLLLELTARQFQRAGEAVALLDATATDAPEFLDRLAAAWQNATAPDAARSRQWQAVSDALVMHRCEQRGSILLVDNAGEARFEVLDLLVRLVNSGDVLQPALTVVLATGNARVSHLGEELLSRVELRIDMAPLDATETRNYLEAQLQQANLTTPALDETAVTRMHELTEGLPRRLNQLAHLVKLAAQADERGNIDAAMVDAVYRELSVQPLTRR